MDVLFILKLGLTGGIGCGKSTVSRLFAEAGWLVVQTDLVARELLDKDPAVQSALRERWSAAVFHPDGSVDRKAIAGRVFTSPVELEWLEALLHPKVRNMWEAQLAEAPDANWLVEIPLLFEKKLETKFNLTVCVSCTPKIVDKRMILRGYSPSEIKQRRERQMSLGEKMFRSDYVISNTGSLEFLKLQTQQFIQQIQSIG